MTKEEKTFKGIFTSRPTTIFVVVNEHNFQTVLCPPLLCLLPAVCAVLPHIVYGVWALLLRRSSNGGGWGLPSHTTTSAFARGVGRAAVVPSAAWSESCSAAPATICQLRNDTHAYSGAAAARRLLINHHGGKPVTSAASLPRTKPP